MVKIELTEAQANNLRTLLNELRDPDIEEVTVTDEQVDELANAICGEEDAENDEEE